MSKVALYFRRWKNYTRQKSKCSFFPTVECVPVWHTAVNHSLRGSNFCRIPMRFESWCVFLSVIFVDSSSRHQISERNEEKKQPSETVKDHIILSSSEMFYFVQSTYSGPFQMKHKRCHANCLYTHIITTVYGMRAQSNGQWNAQNEMATNINRNSLRMKTIQRVNKQKKSLWQFQLQCSLISQKEK